MFKSFSLNLKEILHELKWLERIPPIWKRAYWLICLWYFINFAMSAIIEWQFDNPSYYVLWNAFFLYEALIFSIILIFLWSHWLSNFKPVFHVVGHVTGIVLFFFLMGTLSYFFNDYLEGFVYFVHWKEYMLDLLSWDALRFHDQYIITVSLYYVIRYFQGIQRQEKEKNILAIKNREMQISLLKSQINPHFLFNTLNSISTLVHTSKEQARRVITNLSDIFRYALDSHGEELVQLSNEIEFIENYVKIQQVRFGDRLRFEKEIDSSCLSIEIPPMILQPLIENAVKYGIGPKEDGGTISLLVRRSKDVVLFEVRDNGLGSKAKKVMDGSSSGIGMANTDLRLKSYFGPQSGLQINASENGYRVRFFVNDETSKKSIAEKTNLEPQPI
ncbi:MAG: histidine kinase [Cyclobacteriaceae bacterium]|nr:histidine kinase [Cyclobacteriaceae bacterium]